MTEFGIFARTWARPTVQEIAAAVASSGYDTVHWNFAAMGSPTLSLYRTAEDVRAVVDAFAAARVSVWGISATYNLLAPGTNEAAAIRTMELAGAVGIPYVTISTGTNDTDNMWKYHPENSSDESWGRMRSALEPLLEAASEAGVTIGIEPEHANVVSNAVRAQRLLRELGPSAPVGIVLDPANLVSLGTVGDQAKILGYAFEELSHAIVCLHAKDVVATGYAAAGDGALDYPLIARLHQTHVPGIPVISQDANESDASRVSRFLRETWGAAA